jgi:hypothetical protein
VRVCVDCTLAVLFPYPDPDRLEGLSQLRNENAFGEILLVVEQQISSFLERCSHRDLALVAALAAGRPGAILGALVAALTMARHERVVVIDGQRAVEDSLARICQTLETKGADVVLPSSGGFCPGGYRRSCSRPLERAFRQGRHTPDAALKGLRILKLES